MRTARLSPSVTPELRRCFLLDSPQRSFRLAFRQARPGIQPDQEVDGEQTGRKRYARNQPALVQPHRYQGDVMNRIIEGRPARRLRPALPVAAAVLVGAGLAAGLAPAALATPAAAAPT